jgi:Na+/H+-dicarboxylate symporter
LCYELLKVFNKEINLNMVATFSRFRFLIILLITLAGTMIFGDLVPITTKSFFYAISLSIKNLLVFLLPILIFIFLWSSLIALHNQAGKFVVLLLILVSLSNFISIITGYGAGIKFLPMLKFQMVAVNKIAHLKPTWTLALPKLISTETAFFISFIFGLIFAFKPNPKVTEFAHKLNAVALAFLKDYFIPILPLFILGFLFNLSHEKVLSSLVGSYGPILLLILSVQLSYLSLMYLIAARFEIKRFFVLIKNMIPALITGFSTISSAASLPIAMVCIEKNLKDKRFTQIIVPIISNIHAIGSGIGLTIVALATIQSFHFPMPTFESFIIFAIYYTLAKYTVAGLPGGAIIVAAPLLEAHLGFSPEMIGLITAIYLLFDTIGTATNVGGNGAFAIIFSKLFKR